MKLSDLGETSRRRAPRPRSLACRGEIWDWRLNAGFPDWGTGFVGGRVAALLRERGDDVVALVRTPSKAERLRATGCEIVEGDLSSDAAIERGVEAADAVIHAGADYRVGVPNRERAALVEANVKGTERVIDAAVAAGVGRIVHVSTGNVYGNTGETVADEGYTRDEADGFLSAYDETKYRAHQAALARIAAGAPVIVVLPSAV